MLLVAAALLACAATTATADEAPKPRGPPAPAPNISAACLAKAGPKQNHSMFHQPEFENILVWWARQVHGEARE